MSSQKLPLNDRFVRELESVLKEECRVHKEYAKALEAEKGWIKRFDEKKVKGSVEKRQRLYETIVLLKERRESIVAQFPEGNKIRLSELVKKYCHPRDAARLLKSIEALKETIQYSNRKGREFGQVLNFSLGMVNSVLSILWSATQSITKSYTPSGTITESSHHTKKSLGLKKHI